MDHGISYASGDDCSSLTWAEGEGYRRQEDASRDLATEPAAAVALADASLDAQSVFVNTVVT